MLLGFLTTPKLKGLPRAEVWHQKCQRGTEGHEAGLPTVTRDCKVALTSLLRAELHVDVSCGAVQVRRLPSQAKPRGICSPGQSRLINLTWTFYVSTCASHLL